MDTTKRKCAYIRAYCYHTECECSKCPLEKMLYDEFLRNEFFLAIDRCHECALERGYAIGVDVGSRSERDDWFRIISSIVKQLEKEYEYAFAKDVHTWLGLKYILSVHEGLSMAMSIIKEKIEEKYIEMFQKQEESDE